MLLPPPVEIVYEIKTDQIATKLHALGTGMTLDELSEIVKFIELLPKSHSATYLKKEETKLARTLEIDKKTNRVFIHLKTHNMPLVGKGHHKRVTYSILYDQHHPKLVASAIVKDKETSLAEIAVLERFKGSRGIIDPIFVSKHKKPGKVKRQIITPLYNLGSLQNISKNHPHSIAIQDKVKIAIDILIGSCNLNLRGFVNRDNNKGNIFVHHENNSYSAVLGDLGNYTQDLATTLTFKPLGPKVRSSPPDLQKAYSEDRLTKEDLYSLHVYSLGRALYFLLFEKEVPWVIDFDKNYPHLSNLHHDKSHPEVPIEIARYQERIEQHSKPRLQALSQKEPLTLHESFEHAVLQMLSCDPNVRKSNTYWLGTFQTLVP
ncbi:MAG: hypothetical protein LLF94_03840 [Chlamydiales bacterium]|nr:hypothetical protein [Chlamydiales bacterium]